MVDLSGLEQTVRCPICYGEALHGSAAGWYVPFAVSVGSGEQERHVRVQHARRHAEEHAAVNGMRPPVLCRVPGPLPAAGGQVSYGNKQLPSGKPTRPCCMQRIICVAHVIAGSRRCTSALCVGSTCPADAVHAR